jgi:hypothetical protein
MKSPARRFTLVMLAMSAIFLGGPVLFNYLVDPYDRFGNNRMGVYIMAEREMKATEIERFPHTALLAGNSRIAFIPAADLKGFRFFNGAFGGASAEEVYWFLLHHAHRQELVVLGIDLTLREPTAPQGDIFRRGDWAATAENLVNLQTFEYSLKTLIRHFSGEPGHYLPDGSRSGGEWSKHADREDAKLAQSHLQTAKHIMADILAPSLRSMPYPYYRKIADLLRGRKIPLVVVLPPIHEEVFHHLETMNLMGEYHAWVEEVRQIFPDVLNLTASRFSAAAGFYALDPVHYKPEVGVSFMNEEVLPFAMKILGRRSE